METFIGIIIGTVINIILFTIVILIIGKLGWGIEVDSVTAALLTAVVVAVLSAFFQWLGTLIGNQPSNGLVSALIYLWLTAGYLLVARDRVKGLRVKGVSGAFIAAVALTAVGWLIGFGISLLV